MAEFIGLLILVSFILWDRCGVKESWAYHKNRILNRLFDKIGLK